MSIANFCQINHSPTFGRAFMKLLKICELSLKLLQIAKCKLSVKVLRIPNFYQILIHLLVGELSHGEVSDP